MLQTMVKTILLLFCMIPNPYLWSQTTSQKITAAFTQFEKDAQLVNAIASLFVIDATTGAVVFDKNSRVGLATASTLKVITSVSAYELLGKNFRYKTEFGYTGNSEKGNVSGALYIKPSGDPTFGSWRWNETKETTTMKRIMNSIRYKGLKSYNGLIINDDLWSSETIHDGWVWQDIGNYYGANATGLNWRENQYDLVLKSGKNIGDAVEVLNTKPLLYNYSFSSGATAAAKGTGDNANIYFVTGAPALIVRGTIPVDEKNFIISGAMPSPPNQFIATLEDTLAKSGIKKNSKENGALTGNKRKDAESFTLLHTEISPPLDSIIYWFNRRSIHLW
jgi:D-alanyl-D-alanine carboxypeptidase/D-alanyl-D-alanine-endopeptidase (penicillin-binding protein 4)